MAENSKVGLIVLIIFCVIFAATTTAFFILHKQEHQLRVKVETELSVLENKKVEIEKRLDKVLKDKEDIEKELTDFRSKAERLADKIEYEKRMREQAENKLKTKENEFTSLKDKLEKAQGNVNKLEQKYENIQAKNEELSSKLDQLRLAKKALETKIGITGQVEGVQLGTVVVRPQEVKEQKGQGQRTQGRILVINREFDFVMIDLGRVNGVEPGMKFAVYHLGKLTAEVKVERVYEDMCSAIILNKEKEGEMQEDDLVKML